MVDIQGKKRVCCKLQLKLKLRFTHCGRVCVFVSDRKSLPVGRVPGLLHPRPSEALMCICYRRIDQNLSVWTDVMPQAAKVSGSYWPVLCVRIC